MYDFAGSRLSKVLYKHPHYGLSVPKTIAKPISLMLWRLEILTAAAVQLTVDVPQFDLMASESD